MEAIANFGALTVLYWVMQQKAIKISAVANSINFHHFPQVLKGLVLTPVAMENNYMQVMSEYRIKFAFWFLMGINQIFRLNLSEYTPLDIPRYYSYSWPEGMW